MAAKRAGSKAGPMIKVTWVRSTIGHKQAARGTIRALGLHRLHQTVEVPDTPAIRGMLRRVDFLIEVEGPAATRASSKEEDAT